jgi:hypothetical protein
MAFAYAVAQLQCQTEQETRGQLRRMAPWLPAAEALALIDRARKCKSAGRGLGKLIDLAEAERQECRAWHLQSVDRAETERIKAERRKLDATEGSQRRRAAKGAVTRAEYLEAQAGSERKTKPWLALGMSRSTWQRKGKPMSGPGAQSGPGSPTDVHYRQCRVSADLAHAPAALPQSPTLVPAAPSPRGVALPCWCPQHRAASASLEMTHSRSHSRLSTTPGAPGITAASDTGHRVLQLASKTAAKLWAQDAAKLEALLATWSAAA